MTDSLYRPRTFAQYIGQSRVKGNVQVAVRAARARATAIDHILLYGPPGLGKTTLARVIAAELSAPIREINAPAIVSASQLTNMLLALAPRECLFIDELHALDPTLGEVLYPAMEDGALYFAGRKPIPLNPWTLIGATTHAGEVAQPLRARFGIIEKMDYYTTKDLALILQGVAAATGVNLAHDAANTLAEASRGVPRIANRLLRRSFDYLWTAQSARAVTQSIALGALTAMGIDADGLDVTDRALMRLILSKYNGGPVGLQALASELGEEQDMIEEIYEPYLMRRGLLTRTSRGRFATEEAYKYFGVTIPSK